MITIQVNEAAMEIEENHTLYQLLEQINTTSDGIAVAINNSIISRDTWASQALSENDHVLIIQAAQGG
ncbi:sulfur carrier protein ThiS [Spongiimicrobium salis]|uniref:sulfur carrier protein ThiS n=1 Tax=Spongiimicrobium salis TaxID=1667022 RepID=UPI00374DBCFC